MISRQEMTQAYHRIQVVEKFMRIQENKNPQVNYNEIMKRMVWRKGSSGVGVRVFLISETNPSGSDGYMLADNKVWVSSLSDWKDGGLGKNVHIWPHPSFSQSDYNSSDYVYCLFVGGRWWAFSPGGGGETKRQYAMVFLPPKYDTPSRAKYVVQKVSVISNEWSPDGKDIEIERALGYEGYGVGAKDIRNWVPWYPIGSIVEIVSVWDDQRGDSPAKEYWYLNMPMFYAGPEDEASLRYKEENKTVQAVWI
jgi:hypothetical protein